MQLTIDSNEPLERVLDVVGALYQVQLGLRAEEPARQPPAPTAEAPAPAPRAGSGRGARGLSDGVSGGRRTRSRAARGPQKVDLQAVRAWARENGHQVSDRGRLSRSLLEAYQDATAA